MSKPAGDNSVVMVIVLLFVLEWLAFLLLTGRGLLVVNNSLRSVKHMRLVQLRLVVCLHKTSAEECSNNYYTPLADRKSVV